MDIYFVIFLQITFITVIKLYLFLKINFISAFNYDKGNRSVINVIEFVYLPI